ncbi:PREDICTED: arginine/serine-rich coiled-coil protein 2 isoform X2 [Rhagoletis zephyria]|nr:PREDICTED: arginine/serine-rich coiled-coil protein 2 isoform X2 [Rhagoletis zephyria]
MDSSMMRDGSGGGSARGTPTARRDEDSQRQKASYGSASRSTSSALPSRNKQRDNRDNRRDSRDVVRDHRDEREPRDTRHSKDNNRFDYKGDRSRTREYQNDYKRERDSHDNRRPPREDDRYRPSSSSSSSYKNSRHSGNGRDERSRHDLSSQNPTSSFRQHNHNRSFDHRHSEHYDRTSDRASGRHRRRSNSRSPSPPPTQRHSHSKRSMHDEKSYSRHRTRSRSATPTRSDSRERSREGLALEQARLSAIEMERKIQPDSRASKDKEVHTSSQGGGRSTEALLSLPLSDTAPKQPNLIAVAPVSLNNAEPAVIQLPSYYNPNVINPNRYAEQVQKRKLLWGAKKSEDTAAKWGNAQFSQDTDGKVASKFMRLMGIKGSGPTKAESQEAEPKNVPSVAPDIKTREVMFSNMEQQYEVARQATHTMRGVGLGFSSQARPF